jgi:hypothetical protein
MKQAYSSSSTEKSPDIDENAWDAWLEKGRRQDRVRLQRLKAIIYVLIILVAFAVVWIYVPVFSRSNR